MSLEPTIVKQSIRVAVAAAVLTPAVNVGYGLPGVAGDVAAGGVGRAYFVLGFFMTSVGTILGACLAAYRPGPGAWLTGLGLALVVLAVSWLQGRLGFWLPPTDLFSVDS